MKSYLPIPSHESFKTRTCKFFLMLKNVRYCGKIGPKKCFLKISGGLKATELSQVAHFLFYCPFLKGRLFKLCEPVKASPVHVFLRKG